MWIFLPDGFVSVVENREDATNKTLLVRTRERSHLLPLQRWMESRGHARTPVIATPKADYPYRMVVRKDVFGDFLAYCAEHVDYPNFKNAAHDAAHEKGRGADYIAALHAVWTAMYKAFVGSRP